MRDEAVQSIVTRGLPFRLWRAWILVALLAACASVPAWAHAGPPYPILQNRRVGPLTVSVWSNPDVGRGIFFILIDPPKGGAVPSDMKVQLAVRPVTGRLPEKTYNARLKKLRGQVEFRANVPFDREEIWRVRVLLASSEISGETDTNVQVMPRGLEGWDLLLFLLPLLGIGVLWFKAANTRRKRNEKLRLKQAHRRG